MDPALLDPPGPGMSADYYLILGVHPDASAHAIKAAYRRLAKMYHPDRDPHHSDHMIQRLNEAYAVLSKQNKRRAYDEQRRPDPVRETDAREGASETGNVYTDERLRNMREAVRRATPGNRFESKDALFAVVLTLVFMTRAGYLSNVGHVLLAWPLFVMAVVVAQLVRAASSVYLAWGLRRDPGHLLILLVSNALAAVTLGIAAQWIETPLGQEIFVRPLSPALLAALVPGTVGAGIGRAFNRSLHWGAGVVVGALVGAVTSIAFCLWMVLLRVAELGAGASQAESSMFVQPILAVVAASAGAGALGSVRVSSLFVFTWLEWLDGLFSPPTRALVVKS